MDYHLKHEPTPGWLFQLLTLKYSDMSPRERMLCTTSARLVNFSFIIVKLIAFLMLPFLAWIVNLQTFSGFLVFTWCLAELVFYFWMSKKTTVLSERAVVHMGATYRQKISEKLVMHMQDPASSILTWLDSSSGNETPREATEWISWFFFDSEYADLCESDRQQEKKIASLFGPNVIGLAGDMFRPSLDPVKFNIRPLVFYGLAESFKLMVSLAYLGLGFRPSYCSGLKYWSRVLSQDLLEPPIVFIHGVGLGPYMYATNVSKLCKLYPSRQIFVLEIPNIIFGSIGGSKNKVKSMDLILASLDEFILLNGLTRCVFVGHSYGTIVCSWIAQHRAKYIESLTLIDPVCFMLFESTFLNRILASQPNCLMHQLAQDFTFRDPLLASTFSRNFFWHQNILFPEDIQAPTRIYLSKNDWIIDAPRIFDYLTHRIKSDSIKNIDCFMLNMSHGEYLFNPHVLDMICKDL